MTWLRATCPACGGDVSLRKPGVLREHFDHSHSMYGVPGACRRGEVPVCQASLLRPAEATELVTAKARRSREAKP